MHAVFAEDALAPGAAGLWRAALDHLARRYAAIRPLDPAALPADRTAAVAALDDWAGEDAAGWRRELQRFYDDHAPVRLRRDPQTAAILQRVRDQGGKVAAYGQGPREASQSVLGFLGLERRLDAVVHEPGEEPFRATCAALGVPEEQSRHVRSRAEADAL
jgi:hypothetical protein